MCIALCQLPVLSSSALVQRPGLGKRLSSESEGKILTSKIKGAKSAKKLLAILDKTMDSQTFNKVHASAAYTALTAMKRRGWRRLGTWDSCVLSRLQARVRKMICENQLGCREGANILWAVVHLSEMDPMLLKGLLPALVEVLPSQVHGMNTQHLSNCLWASAQLQEVEPSVLKLVPAIASEIPSKAKDMVPQALSNCFCAAAKLQDATEEVLKVLPAIVAEISKKVGDMIPQALANCLWAAAQLQEVDAGVLRVVPWLVERMPSEAEKLKPQELSNCLLATAQLYEVEPLVLQILPVLADQLPLKVQQMNSQALSNCFWSCAQLQYHPQAAAWVPGMLRTMLERLPAAAAQMTPQELSNSVRVAPRLQETVPEVREVLPVMLEKLKTFPCFRGSLEKKVGLEHVWTQCLGGDVSHKDLHHFDGVIMVQSPSRSLLVQVAAISM